MSTVGIAKRVFGMANVRKTQRSNERQTVARVDGESRDLDGEQKVKEQFNPSIIFLAMAVQSLDTWSL